MKNVSMSQPQVTKTNIEPKKKREKKNIMPSIIAATGGQVVSTGVSLGAGTAVMGLMQKAGKMSEADIKAMHQGLDAALDFSGLKKAGTTIERIAESVPSTTIGEKISEMIFPMAGIGAGKNAGFVGKGSALFDGNRVIMPAKKISYAGFHELGHAMNYNFSKVGKFLQNCRPASMAVASMVPFFVMFTKREVPEEGKEVSKWGKVKNFMHDNAGKVSFLAMTPVLTEEAMATVKGNKLAKQAFGAGSDLLKTVKKGTGIAYLSYVATAAGLALGAWATVKIKDALVEKRKAKQEAQGA